MQMLRFAQHDSGIFSHLLRALRRLRPSEQHRRDEEKQRAKQYGAIHGFGDPFWIWTFHQHPALGVPGSQ
jgi:hypothetical protein